MFVGCGDKSARSFAQSGKRSADIARLVLGRYGSTSHVVYASFFVRFETDAAPEEILRSVFSGVPPASKVCHSSGSTLGDQGPKRVTYSWDVINALTISASKKLPLN